MSRQRVVVALSVCGFVLTFALLAAPQSTSTVDQAVDQTPVIPKFHAESRQVIVEAEAWMPVDKRSGGGDASWVPQGSLGGLPDGGASLGKVLKLLPPPAHGLAAKDFHVFDDGVEQKINYFKEADFSAVGTTTGGPWGFDPTARGIWGTTSALPGLLYAPLATYLIGYIPPALQPGECRTIQIVVPNHLIYVNRKEYCRARKADAPATVQDAKLAARMRRFASSSEPGTINVSVRAFTFWSSGVLSLAAQTPLTGETRPNALGLPAADFTYIVEVHDSKAPATVQITTQFGLPYQLWDYPCRKNSAIHVLGMVYRANGELERQFGDVFRCDRRAITPQGEVLQKTPGMKGIIPTLFDTQIELRPGEYEVRVVVSNGKNFGRAQAPFQVEPLTANGITVSDLALNSILRDASWVVRDATNVTPAPIVPTPLISKNVQFLPVADTQLRKDNPLSVYFEIYKLPDLDGNAVYYRMRITDLKTGATVMNTEPISAAKFVVPGNGVVPVGLKLNTDKLEPGSYRLEVQASDSAGRESGWRAANFNIQ